MIDLTMVTAAQFSNEGGTAIILAFADGSSRVVLQREVEQWAAIEASPAITVAAFVPFPPTPPSASDLAAEADRRVDLVIDPRAQAATLAEGLNMMLSHGPDPSNWPADKQVELAAGLAAHTETKAVRAAQAELMAMDPIPADFQADSYWPAVPAQ